jgi:hypothetical protein
MNDVVAKECDRIMRENYHLLKPVSKEGKNEGNNYFWDAIQLDFDVDDYIMHQFTNYDLLWAPLLTRRRSFVNWFQLAIKETQEVRQLLHRTRPVHALSTTG